MYAHIYVYFNIYVYTEMYFIDCKYSYFLKTYISLSIINMLIFIFLPD